LRTTGLCWIRNSQAQQPNPEIFSQALNQMAVTADAHGSET